LLISNTFLSSSSSSSASSVTTVFLVESPLEGSFMSSLRHFGFLPGLLLLVEVDRFGEEEG
jgi:hypothetical protein